VIPLEILGQRMQVSMVVNDIDSAARYWSEEVGVGPWIVFEDGLDGRTFLHRGRKSPVEMSVALTYHGQTQFELITQHNDAPSTYREFLDSGREGVHHLEFWPPLEEWPAACANLERAGFVECGSILLPDGTKTASYFDGQPLAGVVVALVPLNEYRRSYFSAIEHIAKNWDGEHPVRHYHKRADFLASEDYAAAAAAVSAAASSSDSR
jgi:hypothetical protein